MVENYENRTSLFNFIGNQNFVLMTSQRRVIIKEDLQKISFFQLEIASSNLSDLSVKVGSYYEKNVTSLFFAEKNKNVIFVEKTSFL